MIMHFSATITANVSVITVHQSQL